MSVLRPMIESLAAKLAARKFVVTGELTPPKGTDLSKLFAAAELLRGSVDAINVTESPRARMTMDPRAAARLLQDRGFDTIVQVTSRDRNRIAVQSDLLGAAALGLRNFVFMGGDSTTGGDHPEAKPVSTSPRPACWRRPRRCATAATTPAIRSRYAGPVHRRHVQPGRGTFEAEIENTRRKIDAGAKMLQTQAVYHGDPLKRFIDAVKPDGVAILAGVIPLKSEKSGPWLNTNLPGVFVPQDMIDAMEEAARAGVARERGVELAARVVREMQGICQGVHIMAIGWEAGVPEILRSAGVR